MPAWLVRSRLASASLRFGSRKPSPQDINIHIRTRRAHTDTAKQHQQQPPKPDQPAPGAPKQESSDSNAYFGIPGPAWLQTTGHHLAGPFRAYGRVSERRPFLTQWVSSLIVYFTGDLSSQYIIQSTQHPDNAGQALVENYDASSSGRALCISALSSIPSYVWFIYLSTHFAAPAWMPARHAVSTGIRIIINQMMFAPIFSSYFFTMQSILSGAGGPEHWPENATIMDRLALQSRFESVYDRVVNSVPTAWFNSWKFWPFVTAFSFTFVPIRHRSIFAGFAAVIWQSYLCLLNQRAVQSEEAEATA